MAKIDVTKIEGYEGMSAEEKLAALEAYDIPEPDYSGYVKKDVFDKTAHELAEKKKELTSKLSDGEKAALEAKQANEELKEKYDALLRDNTISKNKAKYIALGYDEKLAEETATAVADGDFEKVFANEKKNLELQEKRIKAELLKQTPKPDGGSGNDPVTKETFVKMGYDKQIEYIQKHPNWKQELNI